MTSYIARFGGLALGLIAIAVGVLIGRVIEAIAVGAVLFAVWSYVARVVAAPDHEPARDSDGYVG
jgi:hypothetical protein